MARGWESKSVEAQLDEAASRRESGPHQEITPEDAERVRQREVLELARKRTMQMIPAAQNERYRKLLEEELQTLESKLAEFEKSA